MALHFVGPERRAKFTGAHTRTSRKHRGGDKWRKLADGMRKEIKTTFSHHV